jgi:hypothetical protein
MGAKSRSVVEGSEGSDGVKVCRDGLSVAAVEKVGTLEAGTVEVLEMVEVVASDMI